MIKTYQRGFTLIELVVVIVILGILAAFAVPRFMGMESEARAATVKNMAGNLRSAAAMARGKCLAQSCVNGNSVVVDGQNVTFINGYPNRATIENAIQGLETFTLSNVNGVGGALARRFTKTGFPNCYVDYNQSLGAGLAPVISFRNGVIPTTAALEKTVAADLGAQCQ